MNKEQLTEIVPDLNEEQAKKILALHVQANEKTKEIVEQLADGLGLKRS